MKRSFQHVANTIHVNATRTIDREDTSHNPIDDRKPRKQARVLSRRAPCARHVPSSPVTDSSTRCHVAVSPSALVSSPPRCSDLEIVLHEEALLDLVLSFLTIHDHHVMRTTSRSWRRRVHTMDLDRLDLSARILPLSSRTLERARPSILQTYSHIRHLDVSGQRYLTNRDLLVLTSSFWIHLEQLVADDCLELSDLGLLAVLNAHSLRLESVSVRRCKKITGNVLGGNDAQLTGSHPKLARLHLDDTSVTWPFLSRLEAHFPTLQHLSALHTPAHRTFFEQREPLHGMLRDLQVVVSRELVDLPLLSTLVDQFHEWCCHDHGRNVGVFERTLRASGPRALLDVPLLLRAPSGSGASTRDTDQDASVFLSPLLYACARGQTRILPLILAAQDEEGKGAAVDLENTDATGHSALSLAVANGLTEATRLLLRAGSDRNKLSQSLASPLYLASDHGWDVLVDLLLDAHAQRDTVVHDGTSAICAAAKNGHRSIVLRLLAAEKQAEDARGCLDRTQLVKALFLACEAGHGTVVADLLLLTELDANVLMDENVSPLYLASQMGHVEIVALLLRRGADANFRRPHGGVSCLYIAAQEGHDEIVCLLVKAGAHVGLKMDDRSTALHIAARMGRQAVATALLQCGAHVNDQTRSGLTPLYIASEEGHVTLVELFVDMGAACDVQTKSGATALFVAVHRGHEAVVHALLASGANASLTKHSGTSPLDAATVLGDLKTAKLLLRFGARVGGLALHFAERQRHAVDLQTLLRSCYFSQHLPRALEASRVTSIPPTTA